jgi:hypothetical protein
MGEKMNNTPRLKNLLSLAKALILVSDGLHNLNQQDRTALAVLVDDPLPSPKDLTILADKMIDIVIGVAYEQAVTALPANQAELFCVACEAETPHQRAVVQHISYYKCTACGVFNQATQAEVVRG